MSLIRTPPDQFLDLFCKVWAALSDEPDHQSSPRATTMLQGQRRPSCAQLPGGVALTLWGANGVSVVGLVGWLLITSSKTKGCKGFHVHNSVLMCYLWGCFQPNSRLAYARIVQEKVWGERSLCGAMGEGVMSWCHWIVIQYRQPGKLWVFLNSSWQKEDTGIQGEKNTCICTYMYLYKYMNTYIFYIHIYFQEIGATLLKNGLNWQEFNELTCLGGKLTCLGSHLLDFYRCIGFSCRMFLVAVVNSLLRLLQQIVFFFSKV